MTAWYSANGQAQCAAMNLACRLAGQMGFTDPTLWLKKVVPWQYIAGLGIYRLQALHSKEIKYGPLRCDQIPDTVIDPAVKVRSRSYIYSRNRPASST